MQVVGSSRHKKKLTDGGPFSQWSRNRPLDGRCPRVGMVWSNSVDAQVGAQRRDNLVAGAPSGLSRSLGHKVSFFCSFASLSRRIVPRDGRHFPLLLGGTMLCVDHVPHSVHWPPRQPWGPQWSHLVQRPSVSKVKESPPKRGWQRGNEVQSNPEVQAAARSRIERLERALAVLGEGDSAEIRGLQAALKEAGRRAAQDRPLAAQVEECQAFI